MTITEAEASRASERVSATERRLEQGAVASVVIITAIAVVWRGWQSLRDVTHEPLGVWATVAGQVSGLSFSPWDYTALYIGQNSVIESGDLNRLPTAHAAFIGGHLIAMALIVISALILVRVLRGRCISRGCTAPVLTAGLLLLVANPAVQLLRNEVRAAAVDSVNVSLAQGDPGAAIAYADTWDLGTPAAGLCLILLAGALSLALRYRREAADVV